MMDLFDKDTKDVVDNNSPKNIPLAEKLRPKVLDEVIGQDKIKDIDDDTMYFIISTLNQLNVDPIRNKLLIKVLPLKV